MPDRPLAAYPVGAPRPSADDLRRRYEAILQSAADGIVALDVDGRVLHANTPAAGMLGWDPSELTGRPHHEHIHHTRADGRAYPPEECPILTLGRDGRARSAPDEVFWRRDGASFPVEYTAAPLWENGRHIGSVVVFRDLSERRRLDARAVQQARDQAARAETEAARRALQQSEQWLHVALQAGRLGAWEWDVATGRISWSPTLERIHGIAEGSFGGTFEAYAADIHPDDRERVTASIRQVIDDHAPHHVEYRIVTPDGQVRWLEAQGRLLLDEGGRPARLVGVCQDVTARKEAEQALVFQKALLEAQRDALPDGLLVVSPHGRVLSYNRRFVEMWRVDESVLRAGISEASLRFAASQVRDPEAFLARVHALYVPGALGPDGARDVIHMRDGRVFDRFSRLVRGEDGTVFGFLWFFREVVPGSPASEG